MSISLWPMPTSALEGRTPHALSAAETALLREWLNRVATE
jgi:hypothetical protein